MLKYIMTGAGIRHSAFYPRAGFGIIKSYMTSKQQLKGYVSTFTKWATMQKNMQKWYFLENFRLWFSELQLKAAFKCTVGNFKLTYNDSQFLNRLLIHSGWSFKEKQGVQVLI